MVQPNSESETENCLQAGTGTEEMAVSHSTNRPTIRDGIADTGDAGPIGVDTINLKIADFDVDEGAELERRRSTNTGTGETDDRFLYRLGPNGAPVKGLRAFANLEDLSVTIRGVEDLSIQATFPKLIREDNIVPVHTADEFEAAMEEMYDRLEQFGIRANVASGRITRLDICRNIQTKMRLPEYAPALRRCSFPRTERQEYEDGGFRWSNGSRELLFYAKGQKQGGDPHLQRLEYRLKRLRTVRSQVGVETAAGLKGKLDEARKAYRHAVRQLIPEVEGDVDHDSKPLRVAIAEVMDELDGRCGQPYSEALQAVGLHFLQEKGAEEAFLDNVAARAGSSTEHRYRKGFDRMRRYADLLTGKERTLSGLLHELRTKLLK